MTDIVPPHSTSHPQQTLKQGRPLVCELHTPRQLLSCLAVTIPGCHAPPSLHLKWPASSFLPPDSSHACSVGAFLFPREATNSMTSWPLWNCAHRRVPWIATDFPLGPLPDVVTQQNYLRGVKPMDLRKFPRIVTQQNVLSSTFRNLCSEGQSPQLQQSWQENEWLAGWIEHLPSVAEH